MLHEIYCEQFHQKRIVFNPGLSVVLGTNAGDNSIGKSTFLLIVDYVFGGSTYAGTTDIIENVGSHDIYFSFIFGEEIFKFCRNSINAHTVWKCNDSYEKVEEIGLNDYCKWLDSKYAISLPELSFRDAVGRYIRVYGKNNCDERHPLHYQATEKAEKACTALLKLFDAYTPLKETEAAAQRSDAELTAYKKAQALQFIAKITKRVHDKNEKEIRSIAAQIEELSSGLERGLLDVDAAASEQAVYIKKLLSRARRARSKVKARWDLLDENGNYAFSSTTDSFADLQHFFPEAAVAHLDEIEGFHRTISSVFKAELRSDRSKLEKELAEYDQIIHEYENILPKVISHDAIGIWWISCSIVIALIKWQKPAIFPSELCAELDAGIVNSKMHHAALELEQHLSGITVILVLLNGIINILLCDLILEFKCNNRETIDKYAQIQCQFGCIL